MPEKSTSVPKKLAIIIASLPEKTAVKVMKKLSPETVQKIATELQTLGTVEPAQQEEAFKEFASLIASKPKAVGGEKVARLLLSEVVGEEGAKNIIDNAKKAQAFSEVALVRGQDLATILAKEQPSTAALILGFLEPKKTADVLQHMDPELREEIIVKLAQKRNADKDVIERVERVFMRKVSSLASGQGDEQTNVLGGPEYVAEIFQNVDKATEDAMMNSIQESSEQLANEVRDLMFTFEDVIKLDDMDMQKVLREVPMDKLVIALRGAPNDIMDKFTRNLSKRARENLMEEMNLSGKHKMSEVEAERKKIVGIIRSLEAAGEISLGRSGGDQDEYV